VAMEKWFIDQPEKNSRVDYSLNCLQKDKTDLQACQLKPT
jgi:hypothetical protein